MPEFIERRGEEVDIYVSFANHEDFLGAVVIPRSCFFTVQELISDLSWLGLYPGGQALMFLVPSGQFPRFRIILLEAELAGGCRFGDLSLQDQERVSNNCLGFACDSSTEESRE